ncbi:hypothetical protein TNIN_242221 [Trichonephila inaurata madagascariensis]|uniref:Uncharacterized protein n=1 Tax=Trichonephila inaurata madagascariensis TaxID=2747483 RepID=A0A8X7C557_9ARAC|nr:hypothetical protein TNIN_242221 [Trichonephila inaurata madagascariensis]
MKLRPSDPSLGPPTSRGTTRSIVFTTPHRQMVVFQHSSSYFDALTLRLLDEVEMCAGHSDTLNLYGTKKGCKPCQRASVEVTAGGVYVAPARAVYLSEGCFAPLYFQNNVFNLDHGTHQEIGRVSNSSVLQTPSLDLYCGERQ